MNFNVKDTYKLPSLSLMASLRSRRLAFRRRKCEPVSSTQPRKEVRNAYINACGSEDKSRVKWNERSTYRLEVISGVFD